MTLREQFGALVRQVTAPAGAAAQALVAGVLGAQYSNPPHHTTADYLAAYSQQPWLRAVTDRIADNIAATHWLLYRRPARPGRPRQQGAPLPAGARRDLLPERAWLAGQPGVRLLAIRRAIQAGELEPVEQHPLLDSLAANNAYFTGHQTRHLTQVYLDLVGEAFWLLERNALNEPAAGWPLPPSWVREVPTPERPWFELRYRALHARIPLTEIVWLRKLDPANPFGRGTGVAQALGDELDTDEFAARHTKAWFYNRARPDLLIMSKDLTTDQTTRLERQWQQRHQGFWRAWKPAFLNQDVKVVELNQRFESLAVTELRGWERDIILQVFGVPPEIAGVIEHCHDAETECLTRRGWLRHEALTEQDEIATWNPEAGRLEYQQPLAIHRYHHDGPMHYWQNNRIDVAVTPQHRMWVRHPNGTYHFETSEAAAERAVQFWRITGGGFAGQTATVRVPLEPYGATGCKGAEPTADGYEWIAEDFAPFLGYFVSEGWLGQGYNRSIYYAQVTTTPELTDVAQAMYEAMEHLAIGPVRHCTTLNVNGRYLHTFYVANKSLHTWLQAHVGTGAANKRLPREALDWPPAAQAALLQAMREGDGWTFNEHGTFGIATVSPALADDLQQLGVHLGYRTRLYRKTKAQGNCQALYGVTYSSPQEAYVRHRALEVRDYTGTVWCVEVPNHLFFTRRNGQVVLHGNSNRATITAASHLFCRYVLTPRLELLRSTLQARYVPLFGADLVLDYQPPDEADPEAQAAAATTAPWALTVDEWRVRQGFGPLPQGQGRVWLVPQALRPTTDLRRVPPPAVPARPAPARHGTVPGRGAARRPNSRRRA